MNFLFVHQFFPGQYLHLVRHLQEAGDTVIVVTQRRGREVTGIRTLEYVPLPPSAATQPYLQDVELGVMNGLAVARLCEGLKREGFTPDVVIGHCGWGEVLFIKDVWPPTGANTCSTSWTVGSIWVAFTLSAGCPISNISRYYSSPRFTST